MRAVLDVNILVSALISPTGIPANLYSAWEAGQFVLLTCMEHLDEVRATLHKPRVAELIKPYRAGRLVNQIRKLAELAEPLPVVKRSPDPNDDYLLALAEVGRADYLVTGDKAGLLCLRRHKGTRIIAPVAFSKILSRRYSPRA
ncbi:MAG: putative toxin-antitoxin system toxin component, PIN family [Bryobacterales bacterium]|nr:putative toxin-antitoxin system toxin component, PIN family [Bryobacterales bacterium]